MYIKVSFAKVQITGSKGYGILACGNAITTQKYNTSIARRFQKQFSEPLG